MAIIIESPNEIYSAKNINNVKLFLAGGITECEDWQSYVCEELKDIEELTIYNPRRKSSVFNVEEQISWEYSHLNNADIIFFWFSKETLNPITLYELGMWANSRNDIAILLGVDPEYKRKIDVNIQTQLAKPGTIIYDNIPDMLEKLQDIFKHITEEN